MSIQPADFATIPADTQRVARAVFPKGNAVMRLRDALGVLYQDEQFADLFPTHGQPAQSPARLAWVVVLQFMEGLTDRQAAEAVRTRIDWKYVLGLDLTDPGFDYSVLSEFRDRLIAGEATQHLLDRVLEGLRTRGLVKARGQQRTDSTHVLATVRRLNRLELVGETLRQALNAIARQQPEWLQGVAEAGWFERYSRRWEATRLPQAAAEREHLAYVVGQDGLTLAAALARADAPPALRRLPSVEVLQRVWRQQYYVEENAAGQAVLRWRQNTELAPREVAVDSPYDPEARYSQKRSLEWSGYKVHLTETCDDAAELNVITQVETTLATRPDFSVPQTVQAALKEQGLLPQTHLMDAGYVDAELIVTAQQQGIDVLGPVAPDASWQAREHTGYAQAQFRFDWAAQQAVCPQGQTSVRWQARQDGWGNDMIKVGFAKSVCQACASRPACTRDTQRGRTLGVRPQAQQAVLQQVRQQQESAGFWQRYKRRAGIEGTLSQGVRAFGLRTTRYVGLAKTHLQMVATAVAINLERFADYLAGGRPISQRIPPFTALAPH